MLLFSMTLLPYIMDFTTARVSLNGVSGVTPTYIWGGLPFSHVVSLITC